MIRVVKSNHVPVQLTDKGIPATKEDCRLYDANPGGYQSGTSKFNFDEAIYGHKSVKEQLIAEQYGKCCFCEADFTANGYGDVEHFRPKGGYTVNRTSKLIRPGYYWLAYDWTNLFLSCEICNQRHKKTFSRWQMKVAGPKVTRTTTEPSQTCYCIHLSRIPKITFPSTGTFRLQKISAVNFPLLRSGLTDQS